MAKQKFKLTLANVGLIALISIISVFIFTSGPSTFTGAATTTVDFVMPFAIDAWGYMGWGDCSTQMNGKAWADQYCQAKGYTGAQSCYHEYKAERWKWSGTAAAPQKGTATRAGTAFTKVKCEIKDIVAAADLVPGTKFEYTPTAKTYTVFIEAKNIGGGLQLANKKIGLEMTSEKGDFFRTDILQCSVLDVNRQRKQDQTVWGINEYLDCGGVGVASTNTKFTFKVDTTNIIAESNEANNELVVGK